MAGIDKTYVDNYDDWKRIVDWAKTAEFTCPNGLKLRAINYCYYPDAPESEIREWIEKVESIPIMNTSQGLDYFLIKYCPIDVVQERMKEVYDEEYYNSVKNGASEYDIFTTEGKIGTRIVIKNRKSRNNYFLRRVGDIEVKYDGSYLDYNDELKRFLWPYELGYHTLDDFHKIKSVKSLIRRLRKMKLPKGAIIKVQGYYIHENLELIVK